MEKSDALSRHFKAVGEDISTEKPPLYKMIVDGNEEWHTLRDAGIVYECPWVPVGMGGEVLEDGERRPITPGEQRRISDIAEEWSASK